MEEKDMDFKIIIPIFFVSVIVFGTLWLGYNIYEMFSKDKNVQKFEGDTSLNIGQLGSIENKHENDDSFIQSNPLKKFNINNG